MKNKLKSILKSQNYELRKWQPRPKDRLDVLPHLIRSLVCEGVTGPYIVQIGANDGQLDDPLSEVLISGDLPAVLVEPVDKYYKRLEAYHKSRDKVQCVQCAIADEDGERTLHIVDHDSPGNDYLSGLSSFDLSLIMKNKRRIPGIESMIRSVPVATKTPLTLLGECGFDRVDVLVIDTEGYDSEVLRLFLDSGYLPRVVQLEHKHLNVDTKDAVQKRLDALEYRTLWGPTDLYAFHHSSS